MPTYEYRCPAGHTFEKFFPQISDKRRMPCPKCGKRAERLISGGVGLVFKGPGFYATDYKRAGEKPDGDQKDTPKDTQKDSEKKTEGESKSPKKDSSPSDK